MKAPIHSSGAAPERAIVDLVREGVVETVDLDAGKAVVQLGDILTPPIDWLAPSGDLKVWAPPSVGEQVLVLSPEGDIERALIVGGEPSSAHAPLFLGTAVGIRFRDGALISHDPDAGETRLQLIGAIAVVAPGGAAIEGDLSVTGAVSITGDVDLTGKLTASEDVIAAGKSLRSHRHVGVTTGGGVSGPPQ